MKKAIVHTAILVVVTLSTFALSAQTPGFQEFLQQFPKASLPYAFNAEALQAQIESRTAAKATRLSWEYYEFLPELERSAEFSNMPVHPEPVAAFETEQYHAVLYNISRGLSRGAKTYSITLFTKDGEYVGTHFIAGVNPQTLTTATIDTNLKASVKAYQLNWANDFLTNGRIGNQITSLNLQDAIVLDLTTEGNPDQIEWMNYKATTTASAIEFEKSK
jgi:hypothetical protein